MKILLLSLLAVLLTPLASATNATFAWDDPSPGTAAPAGYNIYQVITTPPTDTEPAMTTYVKWNELPIDAAARQYVTTDVPLGSSWVLRAFNSLGESGNSVTVTIPSGLPEPPAGFKTLQLVVESSPDLMKWAAHAVLNVAAVPPQQFFRLRF